MEPVASTQPVVIALAEGLCSFVRKAWERHLRTMEVRSAREVLKRLDDHMLRDLGLHRSEIDSLVAENTGEVERTRVRVLSGLGPW
jgi:uncharacterized protein YjiS (DUF1127 family)